MRHNIIKFPGLIEYTQGEEIMELYLNNILNDIASNNKPTAQILLLEYKDVITTGTSFDKAELLDTNCQYITTGRGGKATYHGPGQRIIYPIIYLTDSKWGNDLKAYLYFLQEWISLSLQVIGITTTFSLTNRLLQSQYDKSHVGVFIRDANGVSKIASIGIRAKKWVVYHGFAININTDLTKFNTIIPCGLHDIPMTSIHSLGINISMEEFDNILIETLQYIW